MEENQLAVTIIQSDIFWENPQKNILYFDDLIEKAENSDLFILPEMFSTGFTTKTSMEILQSGKDVLSWMVEKAVKKRALICGSLLLQEKSTVYNSFICTFPDGNIFRYDKKHLFSYGYENQLITPGTQRSTFRFGGFSIMPLICYDLRFPEWCRNSYNTEQDTYMYDILIFSANWPKKRILHWKQLLQARAVENLSYVIGVNRTGLDGNNISYSGNSMCIEADGTIIYESVQPTPEVKRLIFDKEKLQNIRFEYPYAKDWDI